MHANYEYFIEEIKKFFQETNQTNWGKNQVVEQIKNLEIEFLKRYAND